MACENATFSSLINKGDATSIAALVGVGLGGFVLGILVSFSFRLLHRRIWKNPAKGPNPDIHSHPIPQKPSEEACEDPSFSPTSLSHTFIRHSLKPPMNMFSSDGKAEWMDLKQPYTASQEPLYLNDPFASMRGESSSSLSRGIARHGRVVSLGDRHIHIHDKAEQHASVGLPDVGDQQEYAIMRRSVSHSWSESTIRDTGSIIDPSVAVPGFVGEKVDMAVSAGGNYYSSRGSPRQDQNCIQRTRSDPRIAHAGREKTRYNISTYDHRRMRTLSSPQRGSQPFCETNTPANKMSECQETEKPRLRIERSSENVGDTTGSCLPDMASTTEQEPDLTRQTSQRQAVTFYQEHAKRHLDLPYGGPLNSMVLPDSPSGVIGNIEEGCRRDFSLA